MLGGFLKRVCLWHAKSIAVGILVKMLVIKMLQAEAWRDVMMSSVSRCSYSGDAGMGSRWAVGGCTGSVSFAHCST